MKFAKYFASRASIAAVAFALAACGGGGGSSSNASSSSPTLLSSSITSSNVQDVGAQGYSATSTLNSQVGGSTPSFVTGVTIDSGRPGLFGVTLQELYRALDAQPAANQVIGVTTSQTVQCSSGGTMLVNANFASSSTISAGDTLTLTANACKESGSTLDGTLSINFKSVSDMPSESSTWSGVLGISYTNFSVTAGTSSDIASATGDITMNINQTGSGAASFSATGSSLKINTTHNGSTTAITLSNLSYGGSLASDIYTYHTSYTLSGNLGKLGNTSFTVKTLTDFKQTASGFPTQGVLKITATDNSLLTLTVINSTNVRLDLDKNGDGVTDETVTTTWSDLQTHL